MDMRPPEVPRRTQQTNLLQTDRTRQTNLLQTDRTRQANLLPTDEPASMQRAPHHALHNPESWPNFARVLHYSLVLHLPAQTVSANNCRAYSAVASPLAGCEPYLTRPKMVDVLTRRPPYIVAMPGTICRPFRFSYLPPLADTGTGSVEKPCSLSCPLG